MRCLFTFFALCIVAAHSRKFLLTKSHSYIPIESDLDSNNDDIIDPFDIAPDEQLGSVLASEQTIFASSSGSGDESGSGSILNEASGSGEESGSGSIFNEASGSGDQSGSGDVISEMGSGSGSGSGDSPCAPGCDACMNGHCLSCSLPLVLSPSGCVDTCPNGYHAASGVCVSCADECSTCDGNVCNSCHPGVG
jgi:hypothetical protein